MLLPRKVMLSQSDGEVSVAHFEYRLSCLRMQSHVGGLCRTERTKSVYSLIALFILSDKVTYLQNDFWGLF